MRKTDLYNKNRLASIFQNFGLGELVMVGDINHGNTNDTYLVRTSNGLYRYIVQKLHKDYSSELLEDIDVVTEYLEQRGGGQITPKLLPCKNGKLGYEKGDEIWRVLTYIPGRTLRGFDSKQAYEAASMIGRFHNLLTELDYDFKFVSTRQKPVEGGHRWVEKINKRSKASDKHELLNKLTESITEKYKKVEKTTIRELPDRVIHGDLSSRNIRFDETCHRALCLLDLDSMGKKKIVYDIGDMVRCWCMVSKGGVKSFDLKLFRTIIRGYMSTAKFLTAAEKLAINDGIKVWIIELSARYVAAAYKHMNLYEPNTLKVIDLMNFYKDVEKNREYIDEVVNSYI